MDTPTILLVGACAALLMLVVLLFRSVQAAQSIAERATSLAERLNKYLDAEREHTRELTDAIIHMRRDGFTAPPLPPEPGPKVEPLDPEVWTAILAVTDERSRERADAEAYARKALAAGQKPSDVAAAIVRGGQVAGG